MAMLLRPGPARGWRRRLRPGGTPGVPLWKLFAERFHQFVYVGFLGQLFGTCLFLRFRSDLQTVADAPQQSEHSPARPAVQASRHAMARWFNVTLLRLLWER